jgi:hypothetical protein
MRVHTTLHEIFIIYLHFKARGPGQRYRLPAFISAHHTELQRTYTKLSESEKKKLRLDIDDLRTTRVNIVRSNPKALLKDVNSTFNTMEKEVCLPFTTKFRCSSSCSGQPSMRALQWKDFILLFGEI